MKKSTKRIFGMIGFWISTIWALLMVYSIGFGFYLVYKGLPYVEFLGSILKLVLITNVMDMIWLGFLLYFMYLLRNYKYG